MTLSRHHLTAQRDRAWSDVRRIARHSLRAAQRCRTEDARKYYMEWMELRAELSSALRVWAAYRDLQGRQ